MSPIDLSVLRALVDRRCALRRLLAQPHTASSSLSARSFHTFPMSGGGIAGGGGGGGYGEKTYWDARYAVEDKYDWYLHYAQFKDQLLPHMHVLPHTTAAAQSGDAAQHPSSPPTAPAPPSSTSSASSPSSLSSSTPTGAVDGGLSASAAPPPRARSSLSLLIVGCGNSELSHALYEDGFTRIRSIDYSQVVIDKMQSTYQHTPQLAFEVMDVRSMSFPSSHFDVVLDKGTLDAILCGAESNRHASAMLSECMRVLKQDGRLMIITYGQPSSRMSYLEQSRYEWDVQYEVLGGTRYLYVCTKRGARKDAAHTHANAQDAVNGTN